MPIFLGRYALAAGMLLGLAASGQAVNGGEALPEDLAHAGRLQIGLGVVAEQRQHIHRPARALGLRRQVLVGINHLELRHLLD